MAASSGITGPSARIDSKLSKLKLDKLNSNDSSPQGNIANYVGVIIGVLFECIYAEFLNLNLSQVSKAGADGTSMIQCGDGNDTPVPKVGDSNAECGTCAFCHKSDSLVSSDLFQQ